jgi:hypothetical protein
MPSNGRPLEEEEEISDTYNVMQSQIQLASTVMACA